MFYASRPIISPRKGVSEVMGALLLIIVVIVAVASLASFVSIAESNAQKRQSYITSVQDENLEITGAQFNEGPLGEWATANITVRNTNTAQSTLNFVKASDSWLRVWEVSGQRWSNGSDIYFGSGRSGPYVMTQGFTIPARGVVQINLNFTTLTRSAADLHLLQNTSLSIVLLTAAGNFFTTVYNPPTAVGQVGITSVSYQYFNRDVVTLDGSKSQSSNTTKIVSYLWTVEVPVINSTNLAFNCTSAEFSYVHQFRPVTFPGETTQFHQESSPSILPPAKYCLAGPFDISLQVVDSLGFTSMSQPSIVPMDSNLAPPSSFTAYAGKPPSTSCASTYPCAISGTVTTILDTSPAPSTATMIISYPGGPTIAPVSNGAYSAMITCSAAGSITVSLNQLPVQVLSC